MTSYDMFVFYKQWAYKIFNYLQPRICKYIKCDLEIFYQNHVNFVLGTIVRPNKICIFIDNIVSCVGSQNKISEVISFLFIAISHELHHAEQFVNQHLYTSDEKYKLEIEDTTDYSSYIFLRDNKADIERDFNITLDLSYYEDIPFIHPKECVYNNLEYMYKCIIGNIIIRNISSNLYYQLCAELDDNKDVYVTICDSPNLLIKSNGEYLLPSYQEFVRTVVSNAARFDSYTAGISTGYILHRGNTKALLVRFRILDKTLYPMQFENHDPDSHIAV